MYSPDACTHQFLISVGLGILVRFGSDYRMPDDWVHCLFAASVIGADYGRRHCWVSRLLDSPAGFLGDRHRILLHDLETAERLGTCCWWAGFVGALHIDIDSMSIQIRSHLENVVRPFRETHSTEQAGEAVDETELDEEELAELTSRYRRAFLRFHERIGIRIFIDDVTSREALIIIEPNTLLRTTWDYVNRVTREGLHVDGRPYNELPPTEPRIIPHPNSVERPETPAHAVDCMDLGLLRNLFSNGE